MGFGRLRSKKGTSFEAKLHKNLSVVYMALAEQANDSNEATALNEAALTHRLMFLTFELGAGSTNGELTTLLDDLATPYEAAPGR